MFNKLLGEIAKVTQVISPTAGAAGATDINGVTLDMNGYEGVMFILTMGTITATAVTALKAQQGAISDMSDAADLKDTGIAIADDDDEQLFILDLYRPQEQYVRCVVERATANAVVASCIAIQYGSRETSIAQTVVDAVTYELHVSPDEGTL